MAQPKQLQPLTRASNSKGGAQRRLRSVKNARSLVADALRGIESGWNGTDPVVGKVLIDGAKVLAALIEASDTETRLKLLERAAGTRTLPALALPAERPEPARQRARTTSDRPSGASDASASPAASPAPDTMPEP